MNTERLVRQLKREVKAHPKKAALLGAVFVVAVWFWTPLVVGWVTPEKPTGQSMELPAGAVPTPAPSVAEASFAKSTTGRKRTKEPSWEKLVDWIENDPRTRIPESLPTDREPFSPIQTEVESTAEVEEAENSPPEATPEELGVAVSSTIIGPRRRVALINGKAYRQGQKITLVKDSRTIIFTLAEVQARQIVLKREGKRFDVPLPERIVGSETLSKNHPE